MSNIRIDNIAPSAGGTYRNAPRGIAAAWANFYNTSTPAFRDSVNCSSITDIGYGITDVNLTNSMSSANYSVIGCVIHSGNYPSGFGSYQSSRTTSKFAASTSIGNGWADCDTIGCAAFGDLA